MNRTHASELLERAHRPNELDELSPKELARFLRELSALLKNTDTGNPAVGAALGQLAKVIQRHSAQSLADLLQGLTYMPATKKVRLKHPQGFLEGLKLASLELEHVNELIKQKHLSKEELVQLGSIRFGIPKSGLRRQTRDAVLEAVDTALKNEESLGIISREASRQGLLRST